MVLPKNTGGDIMRREDGREDWRSLIEKQAESGLSAAAFCKEQNINPQRFYYWRKHLNCDSPLSGFIRLVPTSKATGSGIRILLDHGRRVEVDRGFDALTLREIVDALCPRG
jgi:hypothetical protein